MNINKELAPELLSIELKVKGIRVLRELIPSLLKTLKRPYETVVEIEDNKPPTETELSPRAIVVLRVLMPIDTSCVDMLVKSTVEREDSPIGLVKPL
jgi:hypothetical protein